MSATIIVDALWGDSGKGKICAQQSIRHDAELAVRAGVGTNAGASVTTDDGRLIKARQLPTGWLNPGTRVAVGSGVLVDPEVFAGELDRFDLADRALVDRRCAVITPEHIAAERADQHLMATVGSTGTGNGPARADFVLRRAGQAGDHPDLAALHRRRRGRGQPGRRRRPVGDHRGIAGNPAVVGFQPGLPLRHLGQLHQRRGDGRCRAQLAAGHRRDHGGQGDAVPGRGGAAAVRDQRGRGRTPGDRRIRRRHRPARGARPTGSTSSCWSTRRC